MVTRPRYSHFPTDEELYNAAQAHEDNIIGSRIAQARAERGLSLSAFSTLLGRYGLAIKRQGIGKWESGDSVPNAYQLLAVCHALNIEEGLAYFTDSCQRQTELNEAGRRKLQEYKEDLIASGRYAPKTAPKSDIVYIEKYVSMLPASAGPGAFLEEENFELVSFPKASVPEHADFGVRVSGDSMEPVYHDGQIVWVQRTSVLSPGEVGLFLYDGDGYIKVYGQQEPDEENIDCFTDSEGILHPQPVLISYNRKYPPKPISPELSFTIAGRILSWAGDTYSTGRIPYGHSETGF